jgi:prolyl oligopeptidase
MLTTLLLSAVMLQPVNLRQAEVVDNYHGHVVADPFRWLEDEGSPETQAFATSQDQRTRTTLDTSERAMFRERLEQLVDYPRQGTPSRIGRTSLITYTANSGLQPQPVRLIRDGLEGESRVLFDPNTFSPDGTVALSTVRFTEDGALVLFGKSSGGSDRQTFYIRDMATGADLSDVLTDMRFSAVAWAPDNSGFFFNRFPDPASRLNNTVYFHTLGKPQSEAVVILARPDQPELSLSPAVSRDGRWLMVFERLGTDPRNGLVVDRLGNDAHEFRRIVEPGITNLRPVEIDGDTLYAVVDLDAPRRKLVAIDLNNPLHENWRTLIPEEVDVISSVAMINEQFVVTLKRDARSALAIHNKDGTFVREIVLPTIGSAGVSGRREDDTMFVSFTSYTYPSTTFLYDFKTDTMTPWFQPTLDFDPAAYETTQRFYESKDGTRIPIFITHKRGLSLNGENPAILYGYGGFGAGRSPSFSATNIAWLEQGGVYAVACIRGGDEYGQDWHFAGRLEKKQNVFDDFIAAAEFLQREGYTRPGKLAIRGGSNGGLLVAAVMLQRPELFGAVVCEVPVTDMLRYHRFGTGRFWTVEYGNADRSESDFANLLRYSPLHNVKPDVVYPPILITTAEGDDRVVPAHSLKFAAALLSQASPDNTVLLRYESRAGHGAGKPLTKVLDEQADVYAFLAASFGIRVGSDE